MIKKYKKRVLFQLNSSYNNKNSNKTNNKYYLIIKFKMKIKFNKPKILTQVVLNNINKIITTMKISKLITTI